MRKGLPLFILLSLALMGCQKAVRSGRPLVIATIRPYELLLRDLLGPDFEVRTFIPANASPHTFNPGPRDIRSLRDADLVLSNGFGLETDLERAFSGLGEKHLRAEDLLRDTVADPAANPHIWLSPVLMQKFCLRLSGKLRETFPAHSEEIANRAVDLVSTLAALDQRITSERDSLGATPLITFHDSFHWFNRSYRIDNLGSVQSSPGREPTPRELASLGGQIRANRVRAICVEPQMDSRSAEVLAREFDLLVIELDPLGFIFAAKTLPELIATNWDRMKQTWEPEASQ